MFFLPTIKKTKNANTTMLVGANQTMAHEIATAVKLTVVPSGAYAWESAKSSSESLSRGILCD
jgi:hypothetical protein